MITSTDLYAMGMESETAYQHMRELCELVGVAYPPIPEAMDTSRRKAMPDPLEENGALQAVNLQQRPRICADKQTVLT